VELQIRPFRDLSEQNQQEIVGLIKAGKEANADLILSRMNSSLFTAYFCHEKEIIGTATIKRPELSYRNYVVEKASIFRSPECLSLELGYVYVSTNFRNQGLAFQLCQSLIELISMYPVFATTRYDNLGMKAILKAMDFKVEGRPYENQSKTNWLEFYSR